MSKDKQNKKDKPLDLLEIEKLKETYGFEFIEALRIVLSDVTLSDDLRLQKVFQALSLEQVSNIPISLKMRGEEIFKEAANQRIKVLVQEALERCKNDFDSCLLLYRRFKRAGLGFRQCDRFLELALNFADDITSELKVILISKDDSSSGIQENALAKVLIRFKEMFCKDIISLSQCIHIEQIISRGMWNQLPSNVQKEILSIRDQRVFELAEADLLEAKNIADCEFVLDKLPEGLELSQGFKTEIINLQLERIMKSNILRGPSNLAILSSLYEQIYILNKKYNLGLSAFLGQIKSDVDHLGQLERIMTSFENAHMVYKKARDLDDGSLVAEALTAMIEHAERSIKHWKILLEIAKEESDDALKLKAVTQIGELIHKEVFLESIEKPAKVISPLPEGEVESDGKLTIQMYTLFSAERTTPQVPTAGPCLFMVVEDASLLLPGLAENIILLEKGLDYASHFIEEKEGNLVTIIEGPSKGAYKILDIAKMPEMIPWDGPPQGKEKEFFWAFSHGLDVRAYFISGEKPFKLGEWHPNDQRAADNCLVQMVNDPGGSVNIMIKELEEYNSELKGLQGKASIPHLRGMVEWCRARVVHVLLNGKLVNVHLAWKYDKVSRETNTLFIHQDGCRVYLAVPKDLDRAAVKSVEDTIFASIGLPVALHECPGEDITAARKKLFGSDGLDGVEETSPEDEELPARRPTLGVVCPGPDGDITPEETK